MAEQTKKRSLMPRALAAPARNTENAAGGASHAPAARARRPASAASRKNKSKMPDNNGDAITMK